MPPNRREFFKTTALGTTGLALTPSFNQLLAAIARHVNFDTARCIILAGPGFTKDAFWDWMCEQAAKREMRELMLSKPKWVLAPER